MSARDIFLYILRLATVIEDKFLAEGIDNFIELIFFD
jgi:hypothetical protein